MQPALRLESWYECSCGNGFFRNLSSNATCTSKRACCVRNCPIIEYIDRGFVVASYECTACNWKWTQRYSTKKTCGGCKQLVSPAPLSRAFGVAYGHCRACARDSYRHGCFTTSPVRCYTCDNTLNADAICSNEKHKSITHMRENIDLLQNTMIEIIKRGQYTPSTARTNDCTRL